MSSLIDSISPVVYLNVKMRQGIIMIIAMKMNTKRKRLLCGMLLSNASSKSLLFAMLLSMVSEFLLT